MAQEYLTKPVPPPELNIPASETTVKVSCIDSTSFVKLPMGAFLHPDYKGKEYLTGPAFSFLIEHANEKLVFDLGIRPDWENLPPVIVKRVTDGGWTVKADKHVAEILTENGVDVANGAISNVIFSHHHWDHVGDLGTFPKSTGLIVGPGFQEAHLPGYPENKDAQLHAADFQDRKVHEVVPEKEGKGLKFGRFWAYDYFGDGSFYLLDTPGHSVGHLCGLARTTGGENSTFVFMGGDACHHGGEFRPTQYLPLPASLSPSPARSLGAICPGHLLQKIHRSQSATEPYYLVAKTFAYNLEQCNWTIDGLGEFDVHDNVFILVAHDDSVKDSLDLYPKSMNDWHQKGLAKKVKWKFLDDFGEAIEAAQ